MATAKKGGEEAEVADIEAERAELAKMREDLSQMKADVADTLAAATATGFEDDPRLADASLPVQWRPFQIKHIMRACKTGRDLAGAAQLADMPAFDVAWLLKHHPDLRGYRLSPK